MRLALRAGAIAIAIAAVIDPVIARRMTSPPSVEFRLPPPSDPRYSEAILLRAAIAKQVESKDLVVTSLRPHALIAIGNADVQGVDGARVVAVPVSRAHPAISVLKITVPRRTLAGQLAVIDATIGAAGTPRRTSTIAFEVRGTVLQRVQHEWGSDEEKFDARFSFAPSAPGVYRVRVRVTTDGVTDPSIADALLVAGNDSARVLVYEPRPSWPVAFVRRSLEADALFQISSTAKTSRSSATKSGETPRSLTDLDVDRYQVVVVGALDDLRANDLDVLQRFASRRGGAVLLVPDRQVPSSVRRAFDLPQFDEVLTDKPVDVQGDGFSIEASELLLATSAGSLALATVQQHDVARTAIAAFDRGAGRVIVSGALDAWRFRARGADAYASAWRALVADAALASPPKLAVTVDPGISRPGDELRVSVEIRETEFDRHATRAVLPSVSASLVDPAGKVQAIRLWPGPRLGTFAGHLVAPPRGRYTLSASMEGTSTSIPLLIDDDVVHAERGEEAANAYAARATGGAVLADPAEVARFIAAIDTGTHEERVHPMRSAWWIVPFAGLLCVEWLWRRRSGLK